MRARVLWGNEAPITITELSERSGLDVELCRRARMLLGLPDPGDDAVCRVQEVEAFRGFALGMELFGSEPVLHFTRVLGAALATVAEGSLTVFGRALTDRVADDPHALEGDAYTLAAFDALESFQIVPTVLQIVAKLQFDLVTERLTIDPGQPRLSAVGFIDLTGSTIATERLGVQTMAGALTRFEEWSVELAGSHGGRVVKYIGDEVMFVAPEICAASEIATEMLRRVDADSVLRTARAGVAYGPVLSRDGDWFGSTVNLASRLVDKAKPNTVLLAGAGASECPGAVHKGRKRLRDLPERIDTWRIG
jgi:adenylate cyclase